MIYLAVSEPEPDIVLETCFLFPVSHQVSHLLRGCTYLRKFTMG